MTDEHPPPTRAPPPLERTHLCLWHVVDANGPVSVSEVVNKSGYSRSLVSPALTDLERRGYIEECPTPTDQRETRYKTST